MTFFVAKSIEIARYAADTTPYLYLEDKYLIMEKLEVKANGISLINKQ